MKSIYQVLNEARAEDLHEAKRSMYQHDDVDFGKSDIKADTFYDSSYKSWKVMHKGHHVGYATEKTQMEPKMSANKSIRHSVGLTKRKTYAYHPGTTYTGGKFPDSHTYTQSSKSKGPFNDKESLSRGVADYHKAK